jgi:hypothetical protein
VVGYHTIQDARIVEQSSGQSTSCRKLVLPISAAMVATGLVVPYGDLADPILQALAGARKTSKDSS